ncbi:MAG: hypothetical protein ERJ67_08160 [Aphanocapsa feldmannii 277cV]|uniref:Uncharacterized protein n=1 Tax=Aphanocapsa feldmannii 277cV TaxID=2507553 RepID=A0A524RM57_9CHRO|nr:MAG: hypothetical protein ERJ67_08160 [Aphanocapsa feldmannii 277cV]
MRSIEDEDEATGMPSSMASIQPAAWSRSSTSSAHSSLLSSAPAVCMTVIRSLRLPCSLSSCADQPTPCRNSGRAASLTAARSGLLIAATLAWKAARARVSCCSAATRSW